MQALQQKRYAEAADILRSVIALYPEEKELHERALLYIRVCERHVSPPDPTPKSPEEQVLAATLAMNEGRPARAVPILTAVLAQDRDNDHAEYLLGLACAMQGDRSAAIIHLTRAVDLNPETRDLIRREPDLEALRQTEEIQALLAAPPQPSRRRAPRARTPAE
jgi:tetratricopeptide (TPR) repeat protein